MHSDLRYKSATQECYIIKLKPGSKKDNKNKSLSFTEDYGSVSIKKQLPFFIAKKDGHFRSIIFNIQAYLNGTYHLVITAIIETDCCFCKDTRSKF